MPGGRIDVVVVRLGAVAVAINAIHELAAYNSYFFEEGVSLLAQIGMLTLTLVIPVGIATILWMFPATVVSQVAPESSEVSLKLGDSENLMIVGVALLGLYAFAFGVLDVLYAESIQIWEKSLVDFYDSEPYRSPAATVAGRIASYGQVAVGLVLMIGRRGVANLILKARGRGTSDGVS